MRFGGEQVLLGFQDCFVSLLCDLGLGVGGLFLYILVMKRQGQREKGETKFQRSWLMVYWGGLGFCSFLVWLCLGSLWLFLDQTPLHFPHVPESRILVMTLTSPGRLYMRSAEDLGC